jgi:hypothetical protein
MVVPGVRYETVLRPLVGEPLTGGLVFALVDRQHCSRGRS